MKTGIIRLIFFDRRIGLSGTDRLRRGALEIGKIWHMRSAARNTEKFPYGVCRSKFGLSRPGSGRRMVWLSGKLRRNQKLLEVAENLHIGVWGGKSACGVPRRAAQRKTSTLYYTTNGTQLSRGFCKKKEDFSIFFNRSLIGSFSVW
jgi:hypothetical protein